MTSRFRGKYLSVTPTGYTHVKFKNSGNHYTYKKATTTVHNIIVGKLWIDNHGEVQIENHTTGDKGLVTFHAYSYFSPDKAKKVTGAVKDKNGNARYYIEGHWDKAIDIAKINKQKKNGLEVGSYERVWTINPPIENSEHMYCFTELAIELNEEEEGVAPTDSRNRPDQRLMENADFDRANAMKEEIEAKQRANRKTTHEPKWFEKKPDEATGTVAHVYNGDYWRCKDKQDWSRCPSIF